jgi:hypothetical protein
MWFRFRSVLLVIFTLLQSKLLKAIVPKATAALHWMFVAGRSISAGCNGEMAKRLGVDSERLIFLRAAV